MTSLLRLLQEKELGSLSTGTVADVVISNIEKGSFTYLDVLHESRTANEKIVPETVIYSGNEYTGGRYSPVEMTHRNDAPPGFILTET